MLLNPDFVCIRQCELIKLCPLLFLNEKSTVLFCNEVNFASFNSVYFSRLALVMLLTESISCETEQVPFISLRIMDIDEYEELRSLPEDI